MHMSQGHLYCRGLCVWLYVYFSVIYVDYCTLCHNSAYIYFMVTGLTALPGLICRIASASAFDTCNQKLCRSSHSVLLSSFTYCVCAGFVLFFCFFCGPQQNLYPIRYALPWWHLWWPVCVMYEFGNTLVL